MNMLECPMKHNRWYKTAQRIPMTGIVVHSTAANNPELRRYVQPTKGEPDYWNLMQKIGTNQYENDWNRQQQELGVHAFVGKLADGSVATAHVIPWDHFLWGCGGGYNSSHIQFEICEGTDKEYVKAAYREAAELCAWLCEEFRIPVSRVVSHYEAGKLGQASMHEDPDQWWTLYGYSMDQFRRDVAMLIDGKDWEEVDEVRYNTISEVPIWARETIQKLIDKGYLQGDGKNLNLSADMVRILVILDRAGNFD